MGITICKAMVIVVIINFFTFYKAIVKENQKN